MIQDTTPQREVSGSPMTTVERYDQVIKTARAVMVAKNHDYGDSWAYMRPEGITDQLHVKVRRIMQLEKMERTGEMPQVDEGITVELLDILNYCALALLRRENDKQEAFNNLVASTLQTNHLAATTVCQYEDMEMSGRGAALNGPTAFTYTDDLGSIFSLHGLSPAKGIITRTHPEWDDGE